MICADIWELTKESVREIGDGQRVRLRNAARDVRHAEIIWTADEVRFTGSMSSVSLYAYSGARLGVLWIEDGFDDPSRVRIETSDGARPVALDLQRRLLSRGFKVSLVG